MKCMNILIATAEQEVYRGTANMLIAPSIDGDIAIMPGHAPLLALLRPGEVRINCVDDKGCLCRKDDMVVFGGYIEVQPDAAIILADAIERAKDIDEMKARQAVEQAKKALHSPNPEKASRALLDLELALAKLRVVRRNSKYPSVKP